MERHGRKNLQDDGPGCGRPARVDLQAWDEFDQIIIDTSVGECRKSLRACVQAAGGQFEYKLTF
jgi:hypothetical protein